MDFAKAFDKVPHNRLIQKMERYSIQGPLKRWVQSFLSSHMQRVVCEGEMSTWEPVTSGVPQGSVIDPILFLLFINDLPDGFKSQVRLFADDSIVYMAVSNTSDAEALQKYLNLLEEWEKWQMIFHPQKCHVLRVTRSRKPFIYKYSLHGHILEEKETAKCVGVTCHNKLSWNDHISSTCKKQTLQ